MNMQQTDFLNNKELEFYLVFELFFLLPLSSVFSLVMGMLCVLLPLLTVVLHELDREGGQDVREQQDDGDLQQYDLSALLRRLAR